MVPSLDTPAEDFLREIETAPIAKPYKMPIMAVFFFDYSVKKAIASDDVISSVRDFCKCGMASADFSSSTDDKNILANARKNPIICPYLDNPVFASHASDAIELRIAEYFRNRYEKKR